MPPKCYRGRQKIYCRTERRPRKKAGQAPQPYQGYELVNPKNIL